MKKFFIFLAFIFCFNMYAPLEEAEKPIEIDKLENRQDVKDLQNELDQKEEYYKKSKDDLAQIDKQKTSASRKKAASTLGIDLGETEKFVTSYESAEEKLTSAAKRLDIDLKSLKQGMVKAVGSGEPGVGKQESLEDSLRAIDKKHLGADTAYSSEDISERESAITSFMDKLSSSNDIIADAAKLDSSKRVDLLSRNINTFESAKEALEDELFAVDDALKTTKKNDPELEKYKSILEQQRDELNKRVSALENTEFDVVVQKKSAIRSSVVRVGKWLSDAVAKVKSIFSDKSDAFSTTAESTMVQLQDQANDFATESIRFMSLSGGIVSNAQAVAEKYENMDKSLSASPQAQEEKRQELNESVKMLKSIESMAQGKTKDFDSMYEKTVQLRDQVSDTLNYRSKGDFSSLFERNHANFQRTFGNGDIYKTVGVDKDNFSEKALETSFKQFKKEQNFNPKNMFEQERLKRELDAFDADGNNLGSKNYLMVKNAEKGDQSQIWKILTESERQQRIDLVKKFEEFRKTNPVKMDFKEYKRDYEDMLRRKQAAFDVLRTPEMKEVYDAYQKDLTAAWQKNYLDSNGSLTRSGSSYFKKNGALAKIELTSKQAASLEQFSKTVFKNQFTSVHNSGLILEDKQKMFSKNVVEVRKRLEALQKKGVSFVPEMPG